MEDMLVGSQQGELSVFPRDQGQQETCLMVAAREKYGNVSNAQAEIFKQPGFDINARVSLFNMILL